MTFQPVRASSGTVIVNVSRRRCRMIASGLGIGVVPAFMEHSHGRIYNLVFIPLTEDWAHPEIRIVVRDLQTLPGAPPRFPSRPTSVFACPCCTSCTCLNNTGTTPPTHHRQPP